MLLGRRARYYYKNTFIVLFTFVLSMGKKNGYTVNGGDECPSCLPIKSRPLSVNRHDTRL